MPRLGSRATGSAKAAAWLSQSEMGDRLGLTARQVANLATDNVLPTRVKGARREYAWPAGLHAYIEHKVVSAQPSTLQESQARKAAADALKAEIELAQLRGQVVPAETVESVAGEMADRLRAVLINLPSNYALDLERLGVRPEDAEQVLGAIAERLTGALRGTMDEDAAAA